MALAIDASSPGTAVNTVGTTQTVTSASFTPPANSLLVILWSSNMGGGDTPSTPTITDNLGAHLTYTQANFASQGSGTTANGQAAIFTAPVASSAAMTVTVTCSALTSNGFRHSAMRILVMTDGGNTPTVGTNARGGVTVASSTLAAAYTATQTGSWGFLSVSDWDDVGAETAGAGTTLIDSADNSAQFVYGFFRRTTADGVNGSATTQNVTFPANTANAPWVAVEIKGTAAGGTAAPPARPAAPGQTWRRHFKHRQAPQPGTVVAATPDDPPQTRPLVAAGAALPVGQLGGRVFTSTGTVEVEAVASVEPLIVGAVRPPDLEGRALIRSGTVDPSVAPSATPIEPLIVGAVRPPDLEGRAFIRSGTVDPSVVVSTPSTEPLIVGAVRPPDLEGRAFIRSGTVEAIAAGRPLVVTAGPIPAPVSSPLVSRTGADPAAPAPQVPVGPTVVLAAPIPPAVAPPVVGKPIVDPPPAGTFPLPKALVVDRIGLPPEPGRAVIGHGTVDPAAPAPQVPVASVVVTAGPIPPATSPASVARSAVDPAAVTPVGPVRPLVVTSVALPPSPGFVAVARPAAVDRPGPVRPLVVTHVKAPAMAAAFVYRHPLKLDTGAAPVIPRAARIEPGARAYAGISQGARAGAGIEPGTHGGPGVGPGSRPGAGIEPGTRSGPSIETGV